MAEALLEDRPAQVKDEQPRAAPAWTASDIGAGLAAELVAAGFSVTVEAGQLWVRPSRELPPDARTIIQAHREVIMAAVERATAECAK